MTRDEITEKCWKYCEDHLFIKRACFTEDSDFHEDFLTDPLDHDEFLEFVMEEFHIEATDDEMFAVLIFRDLVDLIESKSK